MSPQQFVTAFEGADEAPYSRLATNLGLPLSRGAAIRFAKVMRKTFNIEPIRRRTGQGGRPMVYRRADFEAVAAKNGPLETMLPEGYYAMSHEALRMNLAAKEGIINNLRLKLKRVDDVSAMVRDLRKRLGLYACQCETPRYIMQHEVRDPKANNQETGSTAQPDTQLQDLS